MTEALFSVRTQLSSLCTLIMTVQLVHLILEPGFLQLMLDCKWTFCPVRFPAGEWKMCKIWTWQVLNSNNCTKGCKHLYHCSCTMFRNCQVFNEDVCGHCSKCTRQINACCFLRSDGKAFIAFTAETVLKERCSLFWHAISCVWASFVHASLQFNSWLIYCIQFCLSTTFVDPKEKNQE